MFKFARYHLREKIPGVLAIGLGAYMGNVSLGLSIKIFEQTNLVAVAGNASCSPLILLVNFVQRI